MAGMFLAGAVLFTSCNDDDGKNPGPEVKIDLAKDIAGGYKVMVLSEDGSPVLTEKIDLEVKKVAEKKAKITLATFSIGETITVPKIETEEVSLDGAIGKVKVIEYTDEIEIEGVGKFDYKLSGTVDKIAAEGSRAEEIPNLDDKQELKLTLIVTQQAPAPEAKAEELVEFKFTINNTYEPEPPAEE